jgi:hypothetical protein
LGATKPNSEVRNDNTFGVLKLTLHGKDTTGNLFRRRQEIQGFRIWSLPLTPSTASNRNLA